MPGKRSLFGKLPGLQSPIAWKRVVAWTVYVLIGLFLFLMVLGSIFNYLAYHISK